MPPKFKKSHKEYIKGPDGRSTKRTRMKQPIADIEQLKHDIMQQLNGVERDYHLLILLQVGTVNYLTYPTFLQGQKES